MKRGIERCREKLTLATRIPRKNGDRINMGCRDADTISIENYADCEYEGMVLVRNAGEMLYQLREASHWAAEEMVR